jgi:hypothetical protein
MAGWTATYQQVMTGTGRGHQSPGIPALALGTPARGPDLPPADAFQQPTGRFRAGEDEAAGQSEVKAARDPQHVGLVAVFEELPQFSAGVVDLVPADEIEPDAVGERLGGDLDGQLALGAEHQIIGQAHDERTHRVADLPGRIHCHAGAPALPCIHRPGPPGSLVTACPQTVQNLLPGFIA